MANTADVVVVNQKISLSALRIRRSIIWTFDSKLIE
jgi:hypothetical protein